MCVIAEPFDECLALLTPELGFITGPFPSYSPCASPRQIGFDAGFIKKFKFFPAGATSGVGGF
ncbi:hypothetical protein [Polycladidibacter stylochi]|uniref:hypothetical protein n=1 Tax=Polycladidibacter stylochi TaxID=1807766 RepID=UPI0012E3F705|nr:hypothetical protein [Pseudovibrio stylochi]